MKLPDSELLELCGKARDNELTPEELARLEALLLDDPEARAFYRRFMHLQSALERSCPDMLAERRPSVRASVRNGWYRAGAAAALVVLTASLFYLLHKPSETVGLPVAQLMAPHTGVAVYHRQSLRASDVEQALDLYEGDELETNSDHRVVISYPGEDTLVVMSGASRLRLGHTDAGGKRVSLLSGYIACQVDKQLPGQQMVLSTPQGDVSVLGTKFVLGANKDQTILDVTEGHVRFDVMDKRESVGTGETLEVEKDLTVKRNVPRPPVQKAGIAKFVLVDTERDAPIPAFDPLTDGAVLDLASLPTRKLNIRAEPAGEVDCVVFEIHGTAPSGQALAIHHKGIGAFSRRVEVISPYYLAGDIDFTDRPPHPWGWTPDPGDYVLSATAFADPRLRHRLASPVRITFKVIDTGKHQ